MQETIKLKLKKPDLTDYVNIADLNTNADAIDQFAIEVEEQLSNVDDLETSVANLIVQVGDLPSLSTDEKTNLVGAINEVFTKLTTHSAESATWQRHQLTSNDGRIKSLANDTDLNTVTSTGFYRVGFPLPQNDLPAGTYMLQVYSNNTSVVQTLIGENTALGVLFVRAMSAGGEWSEWKRSLNRDDIQVSSTPPVSPKNGDIWIEV